VITSTFNVSYQEFVFPMREALIEGIVARFNEAAWTPLTPGSVDQSFPDEEDRQIRGVYLTDQVHCDRDGRIPPGAAFPSCSR
jgi:hypothetical protein